MIIFIPMDDILRTEDDVDKYQELKQISMKIIKLDEKSPYTYQMYDLLDWIFDNGGDYLPFIFLKKVYLDGHILQLPRWINGR